MLGGSKLEQGILSALAKAFQSGKDLYILIAAMGKITTVFDVGAGIHIQS